MTNPIVIYGRDAWPFTRAAREAYRNQGIDVTYVNVVKDPAKLDDMLKLSGGYRKVPVIVDGETVTVGFEGKAWSV